MREVKRTITLECADVFSSVQSHFLFCFVFGSMQLARQVLQERTQMEVQ